MKKYLPLPALLLLTTNCLLQTFSFAQGSWSQKNNFGGSARIGAVGFSIGNKGYIGTGDAGAIPWNKDFWEWDQSTNVWTQKSNFGGNAKRNSVGFSIGTKGYIGTGNEQTNNSTMDFWEYDPSANLWTQKANFGGGLRINAVGFSVGTKGYIGTGGDGIGYKQDFWEYNPSSDLWTQKANFGGGARYGAVGFSIGSKGYIGTGYDGTTFYQDFWEWDTNSNTWTQKANFGGTSVVVAVGFSIGSKGYIGTGQDGSGTLHNDFWEYNPFLNSWKQKTNFAGTVRVGAVGFSIGTKGYIGTGGGSGDKNDFWEYSDNCNLSIAATHNNILCYGSNNGTINVSVTGGAAPYIYACSNGDTLSSSSSSHSFTGLTAGTYNVLVNDNNGCTDTTIIIITQPALLTVNTSTVVNAVCDNSGSVSTSVVGGTTPYTYSWSNGQTNATATGLVAGNYSILITDNNSCVATTSVVITNLLHNTVPICLVTVDSLSLFNNIIWDKTSYTNVDSFIVYREISLNNYQRIGAVPYDSLSLFIDTVRTKYSPNTGNPNGGTYRYKLQVRDTCGNYSLLSLYHNTIFITNNTGNFSWAQLYTIESSSNPVNSYVLMRDDLNNGSWHAINSVSGSQQNVNDPAYSAWVATANWRIETQWNISCMPTIINPKDPSVLTTINTSKSNTYKTIPIAVNEISFENYVSIYPNPTNGEFTVYGLRSTVELSVYNVYGEKVYSQIVNSKSNIVYLDVTSGIYFMKIISDKKIVNKKIVINK